MLPVVFSKAHHGSGEISIPTISAPLPPRTVGSLRVGLRWTGRERAPDPARDAGHDSHRQHTKRQFDGLARRVIQCVCALGHLTHMRRMNIPYMLGDMAQAFLPGDR